MMGQQIYMPHACPIWIRYSILLCVLICFNACVPSRFLSPKRNVVSSKKVAFNNEHTIKNKKQVRSDIRSIIDSNPQYGFAKWKLSLYRIFERSEKEGKLTKWFRNKLGSEPNYYSRSKAEQTRLRIKNYLHSQGYFDVEVITDSLLNKYFVEVKYSINSGKPFQIASIEYSSDTSEIAKLLHANSSKSLLKKGQDYSRKNVLEERNRLVNLAMSNGFLNISKNDFIFFVDTIPGESEIQIYVQLREGLPKSTLSPHYLDKTFVHQDYSLIDKVQTNIDTLETQRMFFIQERSFLKPNALDRIISQQKGDLYSKSQTDKTLNRLLDLGVYKFANIKYIPSGDSLNNRIDRHIYLTPGNIRDISAEIRANTRTGNYLGTGVILSYTDRNLFKGAERFDISLSTGLETQFGDNGALINTAEAGLELNLLLPYVWPFKQSNRTRSFSPKTHTNISYNFEKRTEFYTLSSLSLQFGYDWRLSLKKRHQFYPFVLNRINVLEKTEELEEVLLENPSLKSSFENVYIIGAKYVFALNNLSKASKKPYYVFKSNLETSGNLSYVLNSIFRPGMDDTFSLLGLPFAQFVKNDLDFRYYFPVKSNKIITRVFTGIGVSYGNSEVLPYVTQYYSGGSNGIRAFQIRTLGPGSYYNDDSGSDENEFIDQTGDLKFEFNLEYRFGIWGYLKGALFMDAGNIWLLKDENDTREGGVFKFNQFFSEMAVGTGLGLRLDINAFVLRLDLAFPVKKPYLPQDDRWVIREIDFLDSNWRSENLVWNLGLGYPF